MKLYQGHKSRLSKNMLDLIKSMFEDAPVYVCILEGPEHRLQYANKIFRQLYGGRIFPAGTRAQEVLRLFRGSEKEVRDRTAVLDKVYNTGEAFIGNEFKTSFTSEVKNDSGEAYFNLICQPLETTSGEVYGLFITGYEVTEHLKARQEKAYSKKRLTIALEGADVGFWELNLKENSLDYTTKQCKAHFGFSPDEEFSLKDFYMAIHPEDRGYIKKNIRNSIIGSGEYKVEYRVLRSRTSVHWIMSRGQCLYDENDRPYRLIGITMDITKSKEAEKKLEKAVKIRDDFLAIASHELQTPIAGIRAHAELLQWQLEETDNEGYMEQIAKINKGISQLSELTRNLLDFSRIKEGEVQLQKDEFLLGQLINEKVETLDSVSQHELQVEGEKNVKVFADKIRIGQVLTNLIDNAIKYSPAAGKIIVRYTRTKDRTVISIIDFGIGVHAKEREKIFERFYKGGGRLKDTYPGFGIGLYTSLQIVKQHDGDLWVEDNSGEGSVFSFSLPNK